MVAYSYNNTYLASMKLIVYTPKGNEHEVLKVYERAATFPMAGDKCVVDGNIYIVNFRRYNCDTETMEMWVE